MDLSCILLAGGNSQRYQESLGNPVSKLLEYLTPNSSVLMHSYQTLCSLTQLSEIIIVCHQDWIEAYKAEVLKTTTAINTVFITGGKSRRASVFNALGLITSAQKQPENVLIHDAARPLVTKDSLEKLLFSFNENKLQGATLAHKVTDTIKKKAVDSGLLETLPREELWSIETPQLVNFRSLYQAHQTVPLDANITDDLTLLEIAQIGPLQLIENTTPNIKITTHQDIAYARSIIATKTL